MHFALLLITLVLVLYRSINKTAVHNHKQECYLDKLDYNIIVN